MTRRTFRGGIHPADRKEYSRDIPFRTYLPKGDLVFPTGQHIGKPASPVVKKGDQVLAGQLIAEADGFVSANIISSCSGKVKAVENRKTIMGTAALSIVIENDGKYTLAEGIGTDADYTKLTKEEILDRVKKAGRSGISDSCEACAEKCIRDPVHHRKRGGVRAVHHLRRPAHAHILRRNRNGDESDAPDVPFRRGRDPDRKK